MSKAPNYDGEYPGAGAKIGPVWQDIWDFMEDGQWHGTPDMKKEFVNRGASASTVQALIFKAAKAGVLEYHHRTGRRGVKAHAEFRRTDSAVKRDV